MPDQTPGSIAPDGLSGRLIGMTADAQIQVIRAPHPLPNAAAATEPSPVSPLLPSDFVAGSENALPAAVADGPLYARLRKLSPVLFYGPPLVGKTMLTAALLSRLGDEQGRGTLFVSAADFARTAADARRKQQSSAWRQSLGALRAIAFDGIEELSSHPSAQAEFAYVTEDAAKRGVILLGSARTAPGQWPVDDRIISRWSQGLCAAIESPGPAARALLIDRLAAFYGLTVTPPAVRKLAQGLPLTAAETCGRLAPWFAGMTTPKHPDPITPEAAAEFLKSRETEPPALKDIVTVVCREFRVKATDLKSKSRRRSLALARGAVALLARELTDASFNRIGAALGGRDHTTVMNAVRSLQKHCETDKTLKSSVAAARCTLRERQ
jgi:chromosomal replication initiator protein